MILIAVSGLTNTKWALFDKNNSNKRTIFYTRSINPLNTTRIEMVRVIQKDVLPNVSEVEKIFFYGYGCSTEEPKAELQIALSRVFPEAEVEVKSELYAACFSLLGKTDGVACILGTSSNSCLYEDGDIKYNIPSLGYILGNEGSGSYLGRHLVSDLLKNQLPDTLKNTFFEEYQTNQNEILKNIYSKPNADIYLASISQFLKRHIDEPECYNIVYDCFCHFFERNIVMYDCPKELPINFVGSIAYNYKDILQNVACEYGYWIDKIEENSITGLIDYHNSSVVGAY